MPFFPNFNQTYIFPHALVIFLNTNFTKILSSGNRVAPCWQTDRQA